MGAAALRGTFLVDGGYPPFEGQLWRWGFSWPRWRRRWRGSRARAGVAGGVLAAHSACTTGWLLPPPFRTAFLSDLSWPSRTHTTCTSLVSRHRVISSCRAQTNCAARTQGALHTAGFTEREGRVASDVVLRVGCFVVDVVLIENPDRQTEVDSSIPRIPLHCSACASHSAQ